VPLDLKQIGLAYTQYEQDFDEFRLTAITLRRRLGMGRADLPYVKSAQVFVCPDDITAGDVDSYAVNANIVPRRLGHRVRRLRSLSRSFNAPAKTVLLFEVVNSYDNIKTQVYTIPGDIPSLTANKASAYGNGYNGPNGYGDPTDGNGVAFPNCLQYATGYLRNAEAEQEAIRYPRTLGRLTQVRTLHNSRHRKHST